MRVLKGCPRCGTDLELGKDASDSVFGRTDAFSCPRCGYYLGGDGNGALVARIAQLRSLSAGDGATPRRPAA